MGYRTVGRRFGPGGDRMDPLGRAIGSQWRDRWLDHGPGRLAITQGVWRNIVDRRSSADWNLSIARQPLVADRTNHRPYPHRRGSGPCLVRGGMFPDWSRCRTLQVWGTRV